MSFNSIRPKFGHVYLLGLFFAFHVAISSYINSSFLSLQITEKYLGIFFTLESLVALVLLTFFVPLILKKVGNYFFSLTLILLEMGALIGLVLLKDPLYLVISLFSSLIIISLFYYSIDIYLEGLSSDRSTGKIRGLYLTAMNFGWIFAPLLAGQIIQGDQYFRVFAVALVLLVPAFLIILFGLKNFKDTRYEAKPFWTNIWSVFKSKNLRNIFGVNFLLHFFYSLMVIYMPIYLNRYMEIGWDKIGLIFSVMLIPFVLVQAPLGRLADKKLGEKEILIFGFMLMASATILVSFVSFGVSLLVWAGLLFLTRIGAASVEVMSDTYFFKKVDSLNSDTISLFRTASPLAYISGPIFASFFLVYLNFELKYLFLALGITMILGVYFSLRLKDTL